MNVKNVNRIEVIDENGRSYVNHQFDNKVELSLQDNGKTLKVFITKRTKSSTWVCNECDSELGMIPTEAELKAEVYSCINCGGFEFHERSHD